MASFCVFICIILVSLTRLRVLRFCACQEARRAQTVAGAGDGNGNGKEKGKKKGNGKGKEVVVRGWAGYQTLSLAGCACLQLG